MDTNLPIGKGLYIWQIWNLLGSTPEKVQYEAIKQAIVGGGFTHVYIKIADGTYPYNVRWANYPRWSGPILEDYAVQLAGLLREAGVVVYGWHYVRGDGPLDEADIVIKRIEQVGAIGLGIDAEKEYKLPGKWRAAQTYSRALRLGAPMTAIALTSYRYPTLHPQIPYLQFLEVCDYINQQLYWEKSHNPVEQLKRSISEYDKLLEKLGVGPLPQCPIGSTYGVGTWRATPGDVMAFFTAAKKDLLSASVWSMDWMLNPRNKAEDLWNATTGFSWSAELPPCVSWDSLTEPDQIAYVQKYGLVGSNPNRCLLNDL